MLEILRVKLGGSRRQGKVFPKATRLSADINVWNFIR